MRNRMKRAVLMILTLLLLLVPVTAYAETACIVTGTTNYLALRTGPRTSETNEIGKLYNGETFYVTDSGVNGFAYGYTSRGEYGYVNSKYLRAKGSQAPQQYQTPQYQTPQYQTPQYQTPQYQAPQQYGSAMTVTGTRNYLALRTSPVRNDNNEIGRLYNGQVFYVTEWLNSGFAYGHTSSGQYGYVVSAYLR